MPRHERHLQRHEILSRDDLVRLLHQGADLSHYVFRALDLSEIHHWGETPLEGALFLGCTFDSLAHKLEVESRGASVFPEIPDLPYHPYRARLYDVEELLHGYQEGGYFHTTDYTIYHHFDTLRHASCGVPLIETLAQRIHDHAIDDALQELLATIDPLRVVGVMGGHGTSRTDPWYRRVALTCWQLARRGYFIASGGGPGIMEAANLGAYLSCYADPAILDVALEKLSHAPKYSGGFLPEAPEFPAAIDAYIATARQVVIELGLDPTPDTRASYQRDRPDPGPSLAVPTWFYGHEPSNLFSPFIAKYFANSIREDGLLAISLAGVVYAPGSAGTLQEVFMDLAQNHYSTFVWRSPMVFLDSQTYGRWFELILEFVRLRQSPNAPYEDLLTLVDTPDEVTAFIEKNHPRKLR